MEILLWAAKSVCIAQGLGEAEHNTGERTGKGAHTHTPEYAHG